MRLLVLLLLAALALTVLRRAAIGRDPDPWARAARRVGPLLASIEAELRAQGRDADAERVAACGRIVRGWAA